MKFGLRIPSLRKRIAARTSLKRYVRHSLASKLHEAGAGSRILVEPSTTGSTTEPPSVSAVSLGRDGEPSQGAWSCWSFWDCC